MINFELIEKIVGDISSLHPMEKSVLLEKLFETKSIDYVEISKSYVVNLESQNKKKLQAINELSMQLGAVCIGSKSVFAEQARRYLWENKYYTGMDGTAFGKTLEQEFNNNQQ